MPTLPASGRGPSFSRPGSILLPKDRLLYQALADAAAPIAERATDRTRSFSHVLSSRGSGMFVSSRLCWNRMQKALAALSDAHPKSYVIKADVANCFASVNQHTLVNHLEGVGYPAALKNALDAFLVLNTGDRSSRGILQGMFPSDLLGNFYLTPVDQCMSDIGIPSIRYVDDFYLFVSSVAQAEDVTRLLTLKLRDYDLVLNESKSKLLNIKSLFTEEPDLEALFANALAERTSQVADDEELDTNYGFQSEWEDAEEERDEDNNEDNLELQATKSLFDRVAEFPINVEKIERFCLPLFASAESDYAIDHVLQSFVRHPAMSQIYCSYLSHFVLEEKVLAALEGYLTTPDVYFDWQRIWLLAALLTCSTVSDEIVRVALGIYRDGRKHEALRAVAAILVAKHGSFTRRKELADNYGLAGSIYLQTALLYGARYFSRQSRTTAIKAWSGHSSTHRLLAAGIGGS